MYGPLPPTLSAGQLLSNFEAGGNQAAVRTILQESVAHRGLDKGTFNRNSSKKIVKLSSILL